MPDEQAGQALLSHVLTTLIGPLHGVPIALKEQYMISGTPATVGLLSYKSRVMEREGPLLTQLRQAGAIILGKTNASQLLLSLSGTCENPVYGRTNNPWNLARAPGGSSGGEAAIIAAGGSPLGLGADAGGSIWIPAHFCGLYSLLPTARRLTNLDTAPHAEVAGQEAILAQPCPIARSVQDLRLVMDVLAAPGLNALDPSVPPVPRPDPTVVSLPGLRIGMYTENGVLSVAPAVRRAVEEAAQILRARGAIIESWNPPDVAEMVSLPGAVRVPLAGLLRRSGQAHLASSLQSLRGTLVGRSVLADGGRAQSVSPAFPGRVRC